MWLHGIAREYRYCRRSGRGWVRFHAVRILPGRTQTGADFTYAKITLLSERPSWILRHALVWNSNSPNQPQALVTLTLCLPIGRQPYEYSHHDCMCGEPREQKQRFMLYFLTFTSTLRADENVLFPFHPRQRFTCLSWIASRTGYIYQRIHVRLGEKTASCYSTHCRPTRLCMFHSFVSVKFELRVFKVCIGHLRVHVSCNLQDLL